MDEVLTVEEAAKQLRVSPDTIRRLLRDKKLQGIRVGGQWRVPFSALQRAALPGGGALLNEQIVTLAEHEFGDLKIPPGTLAYVIAETRGVGGIYHDTITVSERPTPQRDCTNFELDLSQQNVTWKFVSNDGVSQSVEVSRSLLRDIRKHVNSAYSTTMDENGRAALCEAYLLVRTALGTNDQSDGDTIPKALDARARAMVGLAVQSTT